MDRMILNRETEAILLAPNGRITIHFHTSGCKIIFDTEASKQMKLKVGDFLEFEVDNKEWYVFKTENNNGYKLCRNDNGRSKMMAIYSNKLIRFFSVTHKDRKYILVKEESNKFYPYPRFKITTINNLKKINSNE